MHVGAGTTVAAVAVGMSGIHIGVLAPRICTVNVYRPHFDNSSSQMSLQFKKALAALIWESS